MPLLQKLVLQAQRLIPMEDFQYIGIRVEEKGHMSSLSNISQNLLNHFSENHKDLKTLKYWDPKWFNQKF